jgi:hypothetical protein
MRASADALLNAPLFVVGCPGSGTGGVGRILGAHPRVVYWDRASDLVPHGARVLRGEVGAEEGRALYLDVCRRWLRTRSLASIQRFALGCSGHALLVPFLARAFPDARLLHVLRDGRVVARSLAARSVVTCSRLEASVSVGLDGRDVREACRDRSWVPADLRAEFEAGAPAARAALTWVIHVRAALQGRAVAADRYFEVRYEDLVADPIGWGGRVLAFAGVGMDPTVERALRRIELQPRADPAADVRGEERRRDERALVEARAGDLLRELGYDVGGTV